MPSLTAGAMAWLLLGTSCFHDDTCHQWLGSQREPFDCFTMSADTIPTYFMPIIVVRGLPGYHRLPPVFSITRTPHTQTPLLPWQWTGSHRKTLHVFLVDWDQHCPRPTRVQGSHWLGARARGCYSSQPSGVSDLPWEGHCVTLKWYIVFDAWLLWTKELWKTSYHALYERDHYSQLDLATIQIYSNGII